VDGVLQLQVFFLFTAYNPKLKENTATQNISFNDCNCCLDNPANQTGVCMEGNAIGPMVGTCSDWHFSTPKGSQQHIIDINIILNFSDCL
jgi:hypothetical protein